MVYLTLLIISRGLILLLRESNAKLPLVFLEENYTGGDGNTQWPGLLNEKNVLKSKDGLNV